VEWTVEWAGDGLTRVRLVHSNLEHSPLTWENVRDGWVWILDNMKTLLETGRPLPRVSEQEDLAPEQIRPRRRQAGISAVCYDAADGRS
jgi:hypothetical protein